KSAPAWGKLGMVMFAHDYHREALVCLARAEELDAGEVRWPYYQGMILAGERPEEAVTALERAAARAGGDLTPHLRLAETLLNLDRLDEAERHFRDVLRVRADHPRALLGVGLLLWRRGDLKSALAPLERAAESPQAQRAARNSLAAVHQQLGHAGEAARLPAKRARLGKDQPWPDPLMAQVVDLQTGTRARLNQVNTLLNANQVREALALISQVLRDDPNSELVYLALARAYLQARDFASAEQ